MKTLHVIQTLLLLAGVVLPTEATKEGGSSANTTLQAQPAGKHHVQKVRHTHRVDGMDGCSRWLYRPVHSRLICISTVLCSVCHEQFQLGTICQPGIVIRFTSPSSLSYCDCHCHRGSHCHGDINSMVGSQQWPQYNSFTSPKNEVPYICPSPWFSSYCNWDDQQ